MVRTIDDKFSGNNQMSGGEEPARLNPLNKPWYKRASGVLILIAILLALNWYFGPTSHASCNSDTAVDLVKRIVREKTGLDQRINVLALTGIDLTNDVHVVAIRTVNNASDAMRKCEAQIAQDGARGKFDVSYTVQPTDDGKNIFVNVHIARSF